MFVRNTADKEVSSPVIKVYSDDMKGKSEVRIRNMVC